MKKIVLFLLMMMIMTQGALTIDEDTKIMQHTAGLPTHMVLPGEPRGNTTNQGLAIEDQDRIYYSDGTALWGLSKDGRFNNKLAEGAYAANIQIRADDIYYINQETGHIYRTRKDGMKNQKISEDKAYSLNIYKERLYFMDRYNKLYITSMSLNGKDKKLIKELVPKDMVIYNDSIYYITKEGQLGKVGLDGQDNTVLKRDIIQFDLSKQGLYYTYDPRLGDSPKGLYHMAFEGEEEKRLLSETPYSFNVYGDTIYYNHPSKLSLYAMTLEGAEKRGITGANTSHINIAGDFIFYRNLEDGKKLYRINLDGSGRRSLEGKTQVTNVTDLTREIDDLEGKEITPKLKRTYKLAKEIVAQIIEPEMSDYEKALIVHDYVINNTSYDLEAAEGFLRGEASDANAFMAYGVLINQKGVCQGYAEAVQILLSLAGVESELVIGEANNGGGYISHMWNRVRIGEDYYMLDATWDDPVGPKDIILHDYFLVDSETLKKTHTWAYDEYHP